MQNEMAFFDDELDALLTAVKALGGTKKVGPIFWPEKSVEAASRSLQDCLNTARSEKLTLSQVMFIFRKAKEAGCHTPFQWFAGEIGYDAIPVTHADEVDRVATVIEQSSKTLASALETLRGLQNGSSHITSVKRSA